MQAKVSLIIPVYNEAQHLESFFDYLFKVPFTFPVEYVVIDDCSTDNSWDVIKKVAAKHPMVIYHQEVNRGKGCALRKGIALATGSVIAIQDADFEYEANELNHLIEPVLNDKADVVYGSRFRKTSPQVHRTFHYLINRMLTAFSNMTSGLYLTDMETCYKIFRQDIIKPLAPHFTADRFGFEPEVTAAIAKLKLRVHEYPISYFPRNYLEGKKIGWRDGVAAMWFILKFNLRALPPSALKDIPSKYHLPRASKFL